MFFILAGIFYAVVVMPWQQAKEPITQVVSSGGGRLMEALMEAISLFSMTPLLGPCLFAVLAGFAIWQLVRKGG